MLPTILQESGYAYSYSYSYKGNLQDMPTWMMIPVLLIIIFYCACMWRIYTKAEQPGWACILPVYNLYILCRIIKQPRYFTYWIVLIALYVLGIVLGLISLTVAVTVLILTGIGAFILGILMYIELARVFGKSVLFAMGLLFVSIIFIPVLAFGSARYQKGNSNMVSDDLLDS